MKIKLSLTVCFLLNSFIHSTYAAEEKNFTFSQTPSQIRIYLKKESTKTDYELHQTVLKTLFKSQLMHLHMKYDEIGQVSDAYRDELCLLGANFTDEYYEYLGKNIFYESFSYEDLIKSRKKSLLEFDKETFENYGFDCRYYWKKELPI